MEITVSDRVKLVRQKSNLSHEDMATKLGMSRPTYAASENGEREWRLDELRQIAEITGATLHYLIGE